MYEFLNWLVPLAGALLTPVIGRRRRPAEVLALLTVGVSAASSLILLLNFEEGLSTLGLPGLTFGVRTDALSVYMAVIASTISFLIALYSIEYMAKDSAYTRYYFFFQLFVGSMVALVMADNLLQTFIFWEMVGLCSYALIGYWYRKASASRAGLKAFLTTRLGDTAFLTGIVLLYANTGTFSYEKISEALLENPSLQGLFLVGGLLIFWGAVGKSAQFPLHVWLPDAMEGPSTVSALIHAATMVKAGVYLAARTVEIFHVLPQWGLYIAYTGAFTALLAATMATVNNDLKRVLAYSTISQLGLMFAAIGLLIEEGLAGGTFHIFSHAVFKALLFLSAGAVLHATRLNDLRKMGGLRRKMPLTFAVSLIGILALSGVPPLNGFFTKELIISASIHGNLLVFALIAVTSMLTVFYGFRWLALVYLGDARSREAEHGHDPGLLMKIPLVVLAVGSILGGVTMGSLSSFFEVRLEGISVVGLLLSGAIIGTGLVPAYLFYYSRTLAPDILTRGRLGGSIYRMLARGYYIDDLYLGFVKGFIGVSRAAYARIENAVIDGFNYLLALLAKLAGGELNTLVEHVFFSRGTIRAGGRAIIMGDGAIKFDFGVIDGAVNGVMRVLLGLGERLRRVQTGVLEQYVFIVSVAAFFLMSLVLVLSFIGA